jgi:metallo-beta-lactamase class B
MKRILIFTLAIISALCSYAQGFKITHLRGDYYIYTTWQDINGKPFPANGLYIVAATGIVFIDSPWDTAQAAPLLDSVERRHHKKVTACIATHYHGDRTGSLSIFQARGIKTYSSYMTYKLCKEHHEPQAQYYFVGDTTFNFGDHLLETFYPGPGHTNDNIVVWCADEKILYGGCFIKSCEADDIGNIADANLNEWPKSVAKVKERFPKPAFIIPGHQAWNCAKALEHTLKLIKKKRT